MKKLILLMLLGLFTIGIGTTLVGCNDHKPTQKHLVYNKDSVTFVDMYNKIVVNPEFETSDQAVAYQLSRQDQSKYEKVFLSLPEDVLVNITNVCIKKYEKATPILIAKEYIQHKEYIDYAADTGGGSYSNTSKDEQPNLDDTHDYDDRDIDENNDSQLDQNHQTKRHVKNSPKPTDYDTDETD